MRHMAGPVGSEVKRESYSLFASLSSGPPLLWLIWSGRAAVRGPTHTHGPSWGEPVHIGLLHASDRRHRVRAGLPSRPERASGGRSQTDRYAPRATRHIRSAR